MALPNPSKPSNRVLIIDDEETSRHTLYVFLATEKYQLTTRESGIHALQEMDTLNPDVILLDVMMPEMDGFEVCRRLKVHPQWQHIPVILVTAMDDRKTMIEGLNAGADEFLAKPVNGSELRARVRSMMRIKNQFDALNNALTLREDLSNMIAHDMRSPLGVIMAYSHLLQQGFISQEEYPHILEEIHYEASRLNSFINDLLLVAKTEHNTLVINRTPLNLQDVLPQLQQNHRLIANLKNITLAMQLPEESLSIYVDASMFQRLLELFLNNKGRSSIIRRKYR